MRGLPFETNQNRYQARDGYWYNGYSSDIEADYGFDKAYQRLVEDIQKQLDLSNYQDHGNGD